MSSPADHYGAAEHELELADKVRDEPDPTTDPRLQAGHIARAAIHALLALVDALDDMGGNRP